MTASALATAFSDILTKEKPPYTIEAFKRHVPKGMGGAAFAKVYAKLSLPLSKPALQAAATTLSVVASLPPASEPPPSPPAPATPPPVVVTPLVPTDPNPPSTGPTSPVSEDAVDISAVTDWRSIPDATSIMWQGVKLGSQCPGKPYSLQLSDSTGVERYEIRAGEHCSNDGKGTDKRRSELSGMTTRDQGVITFEYELLVEDAPFADPCQYVMGQPHKGKANNGVTGDHPFGAFRIVQGGFPGFTIAGSNAYPLTAADVAAAKSITAWTGRERFPFGRWVKIKIVLSQGGDDQYAELWMDDQMMVHYVPPAGQAIGYKNPEAPPYWKRGIYNAQGNLTKQACVAYFRNVKSG